LARAAQSADEGGPEAVAVRPAAAEPADPAVPPAVVPVAVRAAVVPPAALLPGLPLHEDSSEAPPAAAANRRNVRRRGEATADGRAFGLPGSALSLAVSAIVVVLPFAVPACPV
jgi:hypothetical protein